MGILNIWIYLKMITFGGKDKWLFILLHFSFLFFRRMYLMVRSISYIGLEKNKCMI